MNSPLEVTPLSQIVAGLLRSCHHRREDLRIVFLDDGVGTVATHDDAVKHQMNINVRTKCLSIEKVTQYASTHLNLSKQQSRVAYLLASGATNAVIAERLRITPSTARSHTEAVYMKLRVNSRSQVEQILAELVAPLIKQTPQKRRYSANRSPSRSSYR